MKYLTFLFIILTFSTFSFGKRRPCDPQEVLVKDIISKIKYTNKSSSSEESLHVLATMHLIASVQKKLQICKPQIKDIDKDWGHFLPDPKNKPRKLIFWDGDVRDEEFIKKALALMIGLNSVNGYQKLKIALAYEKIGDLDKALGLYKKVFEEESKKIDNGMSCKLYMCEELKAAIEALEYSYRIYVKKDDIEKKKETRELIRKFRKLIVKDTRLI